MDIAEHLRSLEMELLTNATRKNGARVASLLSDTFREFGSSGRVYRKEDTIAALQDDEPASLSLKNFEIELLTEDLALVTYMSERQRHDAPPVTALRSSIWMQDGEQWRMTFHQGTKVP